ncbi:hypothetical protein R3P38DRAFT_2882421 [Favolaschia claudopus]|uniref:Uncharacterized protein n=1 Tax=Favolaschia claudopus TaxID=2862362 RepID=A0AAW0D2D3_9AGAR
MPRPPSIHSLHSWWSDSNSVGPTINLHALAKPLMKRMHNRQARSLIKRNFDLPLSSFMLEEYCSYLTFPYVLLGTRLFVLEEISRRASFEDDAKVLVALFANHSLGICDFLDKCDGHMLKMMALLLGNLVTHNVGVDLGLGFRSACLRALSLMSDLTTLHDAQQSVEILSRSSIGAQTVLDYELPVPMVSDTHDAHAYFHQTLQNLSKYSNTYALAYKTCSRLVYLLNMNNPNVCLASRTAFEKVALSPYGAQASLDVDIFPFIVHGFMSTNESTEWSCRMLRNLVEHEETASTVVSLTPCDMLTLLLVNQHSPMIKYAVLDAVAAICTRDDGARAVVSVYMLDQIAPIIDATELESESLLRQTALRILFKLSNSTSSWIKEKLYQMFGTLRKSINEDVVGSLQSMAIIDTQEHIIVQRCAMKVLLGLTRSANGKVVLRNTDILSHINELAATEDAELCRYTCELSEIFQPSVASEEVVTTFKFVIL